MNLYQISTEYQDILSNLYDEDGVINETELDRLEKNEIAMEKKAIAIASFIKNMDAERTAIDNAKKAMADREKSYKRKIESLEGYLLTNMQHRGIDKVTCPYFEIKVKKCPLSVNIVDETLLPIEYKRTKVEVSPDKIKMLQEMKVGVIIPGANLHQNVKLEIK